MKLSHQSLSRSVSPTQKTYQCVNEYQSAVKAASDYIKASMRMENNLVSTLKMGSKQQSLKKIYENVGILIADMAHQRGSGKPRQITSKALPRQISPAPIPIFQSSNNDNRKPIQEQKEPDSVIQDIPADIPQINPEPIIEDIKPEISIGEYSQSELNEKESLKQEYDICQACQKKIKIKYANNKDETANNPEYCTIQLIQSQLQYLKSKNLCYKIKNIQQDGIIQLILCKKCYLKILTNLYDEQIDQIADQYKRNSMIPDIPLVDTSQNNPNLVNDILGVLLVKPKHKCSCQNGYRCKCGCCYPLHTHDNVECPNKEMNKYQIRLEQQFKKARPQTVDQEINYFLSQFPELSNSYQHNLQIYQRFFGYRDKLQRKSSSYHDYQQLTNQKTIILNNIKDKIGFAHEEETRMSQLWNRKQMLIQ